MSAYTIASVFDDENIRERLALFSDADIAAIESALFDKNGKPYVKSARQPQNRAMI